MYSMRENDHPIPAMCASESRFETELEFVQTLANPEYLQCQCRIVEDLHLDLVYSGTFKDHRFRNYLGRLYTTWSGQSYRTRLEYIRSSLVLITSFPRVIEVLQLLQQRSDDEEALIYACIAMRAAIT